MEGTGAAGGGWDYVADYTPNDVKEQLELIRRAAGAACRCPPTRRSPPRRLL
jgi:hypothetical protein